MTAMTKIGALTATVLFAFVLTAGFFLSLFVRDENAMSLEQRRPAAFPGPDTLLSGAFGAQFEAWYADRFPFRSTAVGLNARYTQMTTRSYSRNLYTGSEGYLFARDYYAHNLTEAAEAINRLAALRPELPFYYVSLPRKSPALPELLPPHANTDWMPQSADFLSMLTVPTIDIGAEVAALPLETRKGFYYKGDSHWTADGAFFAFLQMADRLYRDGVLPLPLSASQFARRVVPNVAFRGDLNRQTNYLLPLDEPVVYYDSLGGHDWTYRHDGPEPVWAAGTGQSDMGYNEAYTANLGRYTIESRVALTQLRVLVVKDSFQNPTSDWFPVLFADTEIIDIRYTHDKAADIVSSSDADLILILYNSGNVSVDAGNNMFDFFAP